jgi:hypothetical protein
MITLQFLCHYGFIGLQEDMGSRAHLFGAQRLILVRDCMVANPLKPDSENDKRQCKHAACPDC